MRYPMPPEAVSYVKEHFEETVSLIRTLTEIPAPSNQEDVRAAFCRDWLLAHGCEGTYIDDSCSVIYPYRCDPGKQLVVFMGHLDTVFPDSEIRVKEENGLLMAPGIGDDTANLAVVMMTARYFAEAKPRSPYGILFVGNSGEEGLGNLRGARSIVRTFGNRIHHFYAVDGSMGHCTVNAVGSQRYRVTVRTEGGHSYDKFGNRNAVHYLSSMIVTLYAMKPPQRAKTTYNVGAVSGGTSVNTIPSEASMLFEFRSCDQSCLQEMEDMFLSVIETYRKMGITVELEILGTRPCKGEVDEKEQHSLWERVVEIVSRYYSGEIDYDVNSTDANIPWSEGIPSTTISAAVCGAAHTYEEWLDPESIEPGLMTVMNMALSYCE